MAKRVFTTYECQSLLENLSPFVDLKRSKRGSGATDSTYLSSNSIIGFPELPEEPNRDLDRSVLCRLCVRLPDGRKVQRSFLRTESVQLLWSFCYSQIDQSEGTKKPFKLIQAFPGEYKTLYYGSNTTFEQSGLANSVVSMTWAWRSLLGLEEKRKKKNVIWICNYKIVAILFPFIYFFSLGLWILIDLIGFSTVRLSSITPSYLIRSIQAVSKSISNGVKRNHYQ